VVKFDPLVDAYDAARPTYPDGVYDALGPLASKRVIDAGAGTGIATRGLRARGADVVALDIGEQMLGRVDGMRVVADGAMAPIRDGSVDLVTFAQCWHWLDHERANPEVARVLVDGGRWAGWWSHPRADGEPWFEAYFDLVESLTPAKRWHRDTDWGATLDPELFDPATFASVAWVRAVPLEVWLTDERSKSHIGMSPDCESIIAALERVLRDEFGDGPVRVRYETWLWLAARR
jgi:SAM-dependent methyltransferase